jgi:hypothetical protein
LMDADRKWNAEANCADVNTLIMEASFKMESLKAETMCLCNSARHLFFPKGTQT